MITYLVCDLKRKKQQIGSTISLDTGRPYDHLKGRSPNPILKNAIAKRPGDFFVFVSTDDGLLTRSEEQYYLDFSFGADWCYNLSPYASGGSLKGHANTKRAVEKGTHPWLAKNRSPELEEKRKERAKIANSKPCSTDRRLNISSGLLPVPIEEVWEAVETKLKDNNFSYFWGRKELEHKLGVSSPTLQKIAKAIRLGLSLEELYACK